MSGKRKKETDILRLVRRNVRALMPYEAKEVPSKVKLDANESPYGFDADIKFLKAVKTNRYPDPEALLLRRAFAKYSAIEDPARVLHGNGSDELIYNLICTFGGPVVYPVPTFTMYGKIATALGERTLEIPLRQDLGIDSDRFIYAAGAGKAKIIFLSSPNNPTGTAYPEKTLLKIVRRSEGCVVVVDEAYQPFSEVGSLMPYINKYGNLAVLRTLSKVGFAALRVGFLVARPELIREVNKVRLPFNVNSFSQAVATRALQRPALLDRHIKKIVSERKRLLGALSKIRGVTPYPSQANFILFKVPDAEGVFKKSMQEGVLLRNMNGVVKGCLRVTVGTKEENDSFIKTLKGALG